MVDRFARDWRSAGLDAQTNALLDFAEKLTVSPAGIGEEDMARLRQAGLDDSGISSCVQVVSYFNYINRIADGLGISPEDWIDETGRPRPE